MAEAGIDILGGGGDGGGIIKVDGKISNIAASRLSVAAASSPSALLRAPSRTEQPNAASWRATSLTRYPLGLPQCGLWDRFEFSS